MELEFEDIQRELSSPTIGIEKALTRRTFLKLLGAGVAISMLPDWLVESAWASPLQSSEGIVVVIQMGGGNDGLNTVVPTGMSKYYDLRGSIAIPATSALSVGSGVGLHPSLSKLKARYDEGKVAIVQGVGWGNNDLSHFDCTANWMSGWAPYVAPEPRAITGWLGRYLDEFGDAPLNGVSMGSQVPLHLIGSRTSATALGQSEGALLFGAVTPSATDRRMFSAMQALGAQSTSLGAIGDMWASTQAHSVDVSSQITPCYTPEPSGGTLAKQLQVVARLINGNVGSRIYGVSWGSFDTHQNQSGQHSARLRELDEGIDAFYTTLNAAYGGQVTLLTFSEFGRRASVNGSNGTDHGTANPMFVIGDKVRGGLYGEQPSLSDLDINGNLKTKVDFHQIYATVLDKWLNADSAQLLGATYASIDLFTSGPNGPGLPTPPPSAAVTVPPPPVANPIPSGRPISFPRGYRIVTASGVVKSFGGADTYGSAPSSEKIAALAVTPDQRGYWITSSVGAVFAYGNAPFHGAANDLHLNAPVVGMASTATGNGYWLLGKDGGIFSYGDAAFYGSTGSMKLNQPVVGMSGAPKGDGYWLVASDGGIFAFGNARFHGSTGSMKLNQPIVGMAATPDGGGYWLVASDGGIFAFGNAGFYGSMGGQRLNKPIVSMASTPTGLGYRLVASDGGVFCFGDATFEGSTGASGSGSPVIGIIV